MKGSPVLVPGAWNSAWHNSKTPRGEGKVMGWVPCTLSQKATILPCCFRNTPLPGQTRKQQGALLKANVRWMAGDVRRLGALWQILCVYSQNGTNLSVLHSWHKSSTSIWTPLWAGCVLTCPHLSVSFVEATRWLTLVAMTVDPECYSSQGSTWLPLVNPPQQPYEVGGSTMRIAQTQKPRTEGLDHVPKGTRARTLGLGPTSTELDSRAFVSTNGLRQPGSLVHICTVQR